ncbi:Acyl-CoA synthetase (AMP-forming)/AMP-acid ligase II [Lentzea albidocapillata subsp. violacea]|uniref:Acyl-CoA synthetase (AMP-forming)/AMP-acid ligase II n=1 Tax=Lentzea albidocapillata subsp. violacea TaxID=128104 RepID=A0A1G9DM79_9PSEU|nr:AMP-binding protein [Lentzea albidocapillata]SDK64940.1 Acyl-CoA synthetase (AMP-forming)/AMP-acid ligase II [Lentzea albidocapillata subsp. violacea]
MMLLHAGARLHDAATGEVIAGADLGQRVQEQAKAFADLPPGVLFARISPDVAGVLGYLAALEAGRAVALLDPAQDRDVLDGLIARFRPAAVLGAGEGDPPPGYRENWVRADAEGVVPHEDLAVLLPTSGSTGNPKFVRLSRQAIAANAEAIAEVLGIDENEVAPTSLPLHYSYGMSVLNSHLVRGATVVLENSGVVGRGFWDAVTRYGVTSLAGVPYHYEMLRRMRFDPAKYPTLRTLTQAGGRLRPELITEFHTKMTEAGGRMFVMYGQTEAGPRMSTLPSERLDEKLGSVGPALPGGMFSIRAEDGTEITEPGVTGEVVYRGPNVMMGYAESEAELSLGDVTGGELVTGDLGHLDADGYLFVTGRIKRIGKVFGNRVSLDDLEQIVKAHGAAAAVPAGDKVVIWLDGADKDTCKAAAKLLAETLHLHVTGFDVRGSDGFPLLPSGKIDYRSLEARA